jgi:serine/threonine protein kinase/tetratricopeptide (TPR) repeat protein
MQPAGALELAGSKRFVLRGRIGEGAVGVVYDAIDRERDTRVAIKTLRNPSAETIHLLKKEFRVLADLQHPNLVSLGELIEERGVWFFTMEFVPGTNLLRYVRPGGESRPSIPAPASSKVQRAAGGRVDEKRLRSVLAQLARGLGALHEANKVHRDVKPSNVLVTPEGRVVILDFGLVSDLLRHGQADEGMQGTVSYMAPEQAASEKVEFAADWYSVGVILYQALTGRLPFYGSPEDILEQKLTREPPPPRELVPTVPEDLDEICSQLLRINPHDRPNEAEILSRFHAADDIYDPTSSVRTPIFVGREPEIDALKQAFVDVRRGKSVTVLVHGESGVGKSFLVRRFIEELTRDQPGTMLLSGRCYERESVAYKAVDGIIDDLSERLAELSKEEAAALLPDDVGLLEQVFPVLGKVEAAAELAGTTTRIASPNQLRVCVFAALRELLDAVARRQPLVLTIDDLQWADNDSMVLLAEVMRGPSPPPLLLVATVRLATESHRPATPRVQTPRIGTDVRHVHLEHLSHDDSEALVNKLLDQLPHGDELRGSIEAIVADTKGHPLFIDELVRQGATRMKKKSGPLRLDDALFARVSTLETAARHILEIVAVAGLPIPQRVAAQASATDLGDLFRLVSNLRSQHFVRTTGVGQNDLVEPYHDRVRQLVLARLDASVRKDWHGRLALALEGWKDADPESLSTHWEGAGRPERAQQYAVAAAAQAADALAFDRAARLYRRALDLTETGEARRALESKLADALTNAGHWAEAADVRLELAKDEEAATALDLRRLAAEQLLCSGHFDRGVRLLRDALAECGVGDPRSAARLILALIFYRLLLALRGLRHQVHAPTESDRAALVKIDTVRSAGAGYSMTDNIRGAYFQTRNLLMALRAGDPARIIRALCMEICFTAAGGPAKRPRTTRLLASAKKMVEKLGTSEARAMYATATGYAHYFVGEWSSAIEWLVKAEEIYRDKTVGMTFEINSARTMLYRALASRGDVDALRARVQEVYREAEEHGDRYTQINLRAGPMTLIGLIGDDSSRVRDEVLEITQWLAQSRFLVQHYFCMLARSSADLYDNDPVAAYDLIETTWPALTRSLLLRVETIRIGALEQRGRAALAVAARRGDHRLLADVEAHARSLRKSRLGWGQASAELLVAGAAATRGREETAREHATRALRLYEAADMQLHVAIVRRRLADMAGGGADEKKLRALSDAWMQDQGVRSPLRLARVIAPGFRESAEAEEPVVHSSGTTDVRSRHIRARSPDANETDGPASRRATSARE